MLANDEAVSAVALDPGGIRDSLAAGAIHIGCSTISVTLSNWRKRTPPPASATWRLRSSAGRKRPPRRGSPWLPPAQPRRWLRSGRCWKPSAISC